MKTKKQASRRSRVRHHISRRLCFQPLENRIVLDASAVLSSVGELKIDAGVQGANVEVFSLPNRVYVASPDSSGTTRYKSFDAAAVKKIVFNGSDQADKFVNRTNVADWIYGKGSNDTLTGGRGVSWIEGGGGDDTIQGGDGNDMIYGGSGNDSIYAGAGNDTVYGGGDNDKIWGNDGDDTISGGSGNDTIHGDSALPYGKEGNDTIRGDLGADTLYGDGGNDVLYGEDEFLGGWGALNDTIYGGSGDDTILGGKGDDRLFGQAGYDTLKGGAGSDTLDGGYNDDKLYGESEHDWLYGGDGVDELYGGAGNDYLNGNGMRDKIGDRVGSDTIERRLRARLMLDSLKSLEASDGQGDTANEVFMVLTGRQAGVDFGPKNVPSQIGSNWKMNTGDVKENILLWEGDLQPGEKVDFVVSLFDHDTASWDAVKAFGLSLLSALPTTIPSIVSLNFGAMFAAAGNAVGQAIDSAIKAGTAGSDDFLGAFLVHIENRPDSNGDNMIDAVFLASNLAVRNHNGDVEYRTRSGERSVYGQWAEFTTDGNDGRFFVRASAAETGNYTVP